MGVVISPSIDDFGEGTPRNSWAVAGAGRGIRPWAALTQPRPGGTGLASYWSTPSKSRPTAEPTIPTIESTAPDFVKVDLGQVDPMHLGLGLAQLEKDAPGQVFLPRFGRLVFDDRLDMVPWRWACSWGVTTLA